MKRKPQYFPMYLLLLMLTVLSACDLISWPFPHPDPDPRPHPSGDWTHFYEETLCSDPWAQQVDDVQLKENVIAYLLENDIEVDDIRLWGDLFDVTCEACHCFSGRRIYVEVKAGDEEKIEALSQPDGRTIWQRVE